MSVNKNGKVNFQLWVTPKLKTDFEEVAIRSGFEQWQELAKKLISEVNAGRIVVERRVVQIQR